MRRRLKGIIVCMIVVLTVQFGVGVNAKSDDQQASKSIVEFLKKSKKEYSIFDQALEASGLKGTLEGEGPFTIFVPTNRAFEQLPKGALEKLLSPENKVQLADLVNYHVTKGQLSAEELNKLNGQEITMLDGKLAKVEVKDGHLTIDGAKVLKADIPVGNGVLHVVNTVFTPDK